MAGLQPGCRVDVALWERLVKFCCGHAEAEGRAAVGATVERGGSYGA